TFLQLGGVKRASLGFGKSVGSAIVRRFGFEFTGRARRVADGAGAFAGGRLAAGRRDQLNVSLGNEEIFETESLEVSDGRACSAERFALRGIEQLCALFVEFFDACYCVWHWGSPCQGWLNGCTLFSVGRQCTNSFNFRCLGRFSRNIKFR